MEITAREEGKSLLISFPFDLKDAFKEIFKTAKWDSDRKRWVVSNSKINHNKLDVFKEKAEPALSALKAIEEQEATDTELANLESRLAEIESKTRAALVAKQEYQAKIDKIAEIKAKIEQATPGLVDAQKQAAEAQEVVKKTIEAQVKKYDIDALIGRLIYIRKQYTLSEHRRKFGSIQGELIAAHENILSETGIDLKALRELYDEDYRKTNPQALFYIARELHSNYDVVDPSDIDADE